MQNPFNLPFFWLGKDAEYPEVVIEYFPRVPLVVVDDTEEIE